jgi:outer membrane protein TolC
MRRLVVAVLILWQVGATASAQLSADSPALAESYTLADAIAEARANSLRLERARAEVDRAAASLDAAEAELNPSISFSGSASLLGNPPEGVAIEPGDLGTVTEPGSTFPLPVPEQRIVLVPDAENTFYRLGTTLSQPVFTWGRLKNGIRAAEAGRDVAMWELNGAEKEIERSVAERYFAVRFAEQSVDLLSAAEAILARVTEDRRRAFDAGAETRQGVLEAEANEANLRLRRAQAEEGLASARAGLAFAVGRADASAIAALDLATDYRTAAPTEPFDRILAGVDSPNLRTLESRVDQAREGVAAARAAARPAVGLELGLEVSGQRTPFLAANWRDSWDTSLSLSVGVSATAFDFGRTEARVAEAEAQLRLAQAGAAEAREGLPAQIRAAYERARSRAVAVEVAQAALALAEERLRAAQVSFENDLIVRSDLLQAEVGALVARIELANAEYDMERALIELEFQAGRIPSITRGGR